MSESEGFSRTVGLWELLVLSIGGMIGSAVFYFPAFTGRTLGPASVLAWLFSGVGMLAVALCYTELATAFPETGGPAVFPAETIGSRPVVRRFFAYLEGTCYSLGWVFAVAVSAWFVASYLARIPGLAGAQGHTVGLALVAIVVSFAVAAAGIDVTTRANLLLTAFVLAALVAFVAVGLGDVHAARFRPFFTGGPLGFLESMGVALTAYGAWTVVPSAAEEVKNPAQTLPRAIIGSLLAVTVLYTVVVFVFQALVPAGTLEPGSPVMAAPLSTVADGMGASVLARYVLPFAALVAIFTTMLVGLTSTARVLFALGRRGVLPEVFATRSSRTQTPWVGLAVIALAACGLVLVRDRYGQLVLAALVGTAIPYAVNVVALVGLRRYRPEVSPTFEAPGGYVLPAVALVFLGGIVVGLGVEQPLTAAVLLVVVIAGFLLHEAVAGSDSRSGGTGTRSDD